MDLRCSALNCDDQHSQGLSQGRGRERTALACRGSTCTIIMVSLTNASVIPSLLLWSFWTSEAENICRRFVSYHRRRWSTATIKLTPCHVACGRRWASPFARSTMSVQSSATGTRRLVPLLSALMAERVTNLCKASFGECSGPLSSV